MLYTEPLYRESGIKPRRSPMIKLDLPLSQGFSEMLKQAGFDKCHDLVKELRYSRSDDCPVEVGMVRFDKSISHEQLDAYLERQSMQHAPLSHLLGLVARTPVGTKPPLPVLACGSKKAVMPKQPKDYVPCFDASRNRTLDIRVVQKIWEPYYIFLITPIISAPAETPVVPAYAPTLMDRVKQRIATMR